MEALLASFLLFGFVVISTQLHCDQCDCMVSEGGGEEKGVTYLHPPCLEGKIVWLNPYGAIRLDLHPRSTREFRACVVVLSEYVSVKVSQEISEIAGGLSSLFVVRGNSRSKEYCLLSDSVPLLLYIEPERSLHYRGPPRVVVQYDIERLYHLLSFDPMEECRPCEETELIKAYCSSDFVVEGVMGKVGNNEETGRTEIDIHVSRMIVQPKNENLFRRKRRNGPLKGTVMAPANCGITRGPGVFLFTGRVRFDQMHLRCAPYLHDWKKIMKRAIESDTMKCTYD